MEINRDPSTPGRSRVSCRAKEGSFSLQSAHVIATQTLHMGETLRETEREDEVSCRGKGVSSLGKFIGKLITQPQPPRQLTL